MFTAMRVSEVINLPWSYVDEKGGIHPFAIGLREGRKAASCADCSRNASHFERVESRAAESRDDWRASVHAQRADR